jgi:hypothetical protein
MTSSLFLAVAVLIEFSLAAACLSMPATLVDDKPIAFAYVGGGDYTQLTTQMVSTLVREVLGYPTRLIEVDDLIAVSLCVMSRYVRALLSVPSIRFVLSRKNRFHRWFGCELFLVQAVANGTADVAIEVRC